MTNKELQKRIEGLEIKLNKTIVIRCTSMPNVNVGTIIIYNGILYYWNGNDYEAVATNIELENAIGGIGIGTNIHVVNTWQDLPLPTNLNAGHFYWVENSTGTRWLPGSLGGTYHSRGLYYSTGTEWEDAPVPYQASQAEVNDGIKEDKFVTPKTLKNAAQWDTKVDKTIKVEGVKSIEGGGDLTTDRTLQLKNDVESPGPNMTYGTDSFGIKGWKPDPSGGGGMDCECDVFTLEGILTEPLTPPDFDTYLYQRQYMDGGFKVTLLCSKDHLGTETILRTIREPY